MRTLHIGLRVGDLGRSLGFYETVGYDVIGTVPATEFSSLTMLKLPTDPFVSLELVPDPDAGSITTATGSSSSSGLPVIPTA